MNEFDFHGHFASLIGTSPAELAFRGATAGEVPEWQQLFHERLAETILVNPTFQSTD